MYCPVCSADYPPNIEVCPRCHADLVPELPVESPEGEPPPDDTFVLLWAGMDPGAHSELCAALDREQIRGRTIHREDYFIDSDLHQPFELYVPSAAWTRAEEILHETFGMGEEEAAALASGALEIPAEDDSEEAAARHGGSRSDWHKEDATAEIWSGEDSDMADMIGVCLRENQIRYRRGASDGELADEIEENPMELLFVAPEDEAAARWIVRQIVDAEPPELAGESGEQT